MNLSCSFLPLYYSDADKIGPTGSLFYIEPRSKTYWIIGEISRP